MRGRAPAGSSREGHEPLAIAAGAEAPALPEESAIAAGAEVPALHDRPRRYRSAGQVTVSLERDRIRP